MDTNAVVEKLKHDLAELLKPQDAVVDEVALGGTPLVLSVALVPANSTDSLSSDQLGDLARAVSKFLDQTDPIDGAYTLEVGTPGVTAPIKTDAQWQRAVGRLVSVKCDDAATVQGRLVATTPDGVEIDEGGSVRFISFAQVRSARGVAELPKEA